MKTVIILIVIVIALLAGLVYVGKRVMDLCEKNAYNDSN